MVTVIEFLQFFTANPILITFIGSIIGGDALVITLAFLAGGNFMPLWVVYVFSLLGFIVSDTFWYYLGKTKYDSIVHHRKITKYSQKAEALIQKSTTDKPLLALLYSKFIYGTRILTIFYVSRKITLTRFTFYNTILNAFVLAFLVLIGFMAGRGLTKLLTLFEGFRSIITVLVVAIVSIILIKLIGRYLVNRLSE